MRGVLATMSMIVPEIGHCYWVRFESGDDWEAALFGRSFKSTTSETAWYAFGVSDEYEKVAEVGSEIVPPQPRLILDGPPYFEDDQPCGYCQRSIGSPHEKWCRQ